ncbi:MAG TPA: tRNA uridine-5-carboxymethylaminomethyl(34) synthesis GTPase MnmE [Acetobacteraceae bacterium]|nr:tRNA uridine-5-carboxymethylaminomethyl(34) synthesis GTPase MnmE [Acetobacteraceae bacterium]
MQPRPAEHEATIFAQASGAGRAALAVLRLSGPGTGMILDALCGDRPPARRAALRRLRAREGEELDQAIVLWFPGPRSYTGEDSAELQLHGGPAVVAGVAEALVALGARPAEAGEFTRRAVLNGRMDLLAAEGIADLVEAETEAQRRQALRQMEGELSTLYAGWADRLRTALAFQEALIDFPDEDLPLEVEGELTASLYTLRAEIGVHLDDNRRGERLREGLVFAVAGAPNVGKSSLVNALAERDVAIVSPIAGTTRDALEVRVVLGGVPVTLIDTAGLRETDDPVEAEGVRRARARAAGADLILALTDASGAGQGDEAGVVPAGASVLRIVTKADLCPAPIDSLAVSARTGAGMAALRERLAAEATRLTQAAGPPPLTRARHRAALTAAAAALDAATPAPLPELRAEELRLALREIGRITGAVDVEAILDTVFSRFCIGK